MYWASTVLFSCTLGNVALRRCRAGRRRLPERLGWPGRRAARTCSAARHVLAAPVATGCKGSAGIPRCRAATAALRLLGAAARVATPLVARKRRRPRAGAAVAALRPGKCGGRATIPASRSLRRHLRGASPPTPRGHRTAPAAAFSRRRRRRVAASRQSSNTLAPSGRCAAPLPLRRAGLLAPRAVRPTPPALRTLARRADAAARRFALLSSHSRRRWRSTTSRRTLPPSSRRSSTRSMAPPGTASWAATSVRGEHTRARSTPALTPARAVQART